MSSPYVPLGSGEIRLLRPVKKSGKDLAFTLQHVSISSKPRYAALSYVWGSPGNTHTILVNGQPFPVRQNLYEALSQLWKSNLIDDYLWVDAVCINQGAESAALEERSTQLSLMKEIYENAARVLVWLGTPEEEECNRLAFQKMEYFEKRFDKCMVKARPWRPWWYPTKPRTSADDVADFVQGLSPKEDRQIFDSPGSQTHKAWLGIVTLLKKPWWTRTWVLQEATIPERWQTYYIRGMTTYRLPSKVRFVCGDHQTTWNALNAVYLVASNIASTPGIDSTFLHSTLTNLVALRDFRGFRVAGIHQSFDQLLQAFRYTSCTDPRDKVYAPLCLATEEDVRSHVKPDYNRTMLDVYTDVVRYYLTQSGRELDFLGFAKCEDRAQVVPTSKEPTSTLPSWVPNFNVSASSTGFPIPKLLHVPAASSGRQLTIQKQPLQEFDRPTVSVYSPLGSYGTKTTIEGDKLCVSGVYIDDLKDIIPLGALSSEQAASAEQSMHHWAQESKYMYHHTGEKFGDACDRTLVLDVTYDAFGRPAQRGGKYDQKLLDTQRSEMSLDEHQRQLNMQLASDRASRARKLGLSCERYLSMVPDTAQPNDQVWALSGGQALYVLRQADAGKIPQQCLFIGECYTHGMMDGEVVQMLNDGKLRMQDIFLV